VKGQEQLYKPYEKVPRFLEEVRTAIEESA
jgi:hypothetical protein